MRVLKEHEDRQRDRHSPSATSSHNWWWRIAKDPRGLKRLVFTRVPSHVAGVHEALAAVREMAQSVVIASGVTMNLRIFDHKTDP